MEDERLKAILDFLDQLTLRPQEVGPDDVEPLLAVGLTPQEIKDAIRVCALFNIVDRVADALEFDASPTQAGFNRVARLLLWFGYRM